MDFETANYIIYFFGRLLTKNESEAFKHIIALLKLGTTNEYPSMQEYEERLQWYKLYHRILEDPVILSLVAMGQEQFYIHVATRILKQVPDKVYLNYCPHCKKIARTPYAKQCRHCGINWRDRIAANFQIQRIFDLPSRPYQLYVVGKVLSGEVKVGMKIDLTFLGVSLKPAVESIHFFDPVLKEQAEITVSVRINDQQDKDYIKKRASQGRGDPIFMEK